MAVLVFISLTACNMDSGEIDWPTVAPAATMEVSVKEDVVETMAPETAVEVTGMPDFDEWEIEDVVTGEQKTYLNQLVEFVWYNYFSPTVRPDCEIIQHVFTEENPWNGDVTQHCQKMAEQNYYMMYGVLPEHSVTYYSYPTSPNSVKFVVRVSTNGPWTSRVRYYNDGKQMGFTDFLETIIDFHITIQNGKLLIAYIDQFQKDENGTYFIFNDAGELVPTKR